MTFLCLDVGSTWTKGALVSPDGELLGTAQHRTTPPEVLDGVAAVTSALDAAAASVEVLACSSAGGGLRLAVVGQERLISAEAGHRVALSAGAKVVHVFAGSLTATDVAALRASSPDVLLLVGGTDGGDEKVLLHNASRLSRVAIPIVLAGNGAARAAALDRLAGRRVVPTANVLPDLGELAPGPARAAIRAVFLSHVIGGKGLSRGPRFRRLVRTVTPDAVLSAVSRLARADEDRPGAVLVVGVPRATTHVYSAVSTVEPSIHAVALPPDRRTVEGDLGMRVSAPTVVHEAVAERLLGQGELEPEAKARHDDVDLVPATPEGAEVDLRLARLAVTLAVRRHLRMVEGQLGPHGAARLVLSGGVFRHATDLSGFESALRSTLGAMLRDADVVVDRRGVLGPAGLLTQAGHEHAADVLLATLQSRAVGSAPYP